MEKQRSIVIIGGGISGLTLGAYIKDGGFNSIVIDSNKEVGGKLHTIEKDGFVLDLGASTTATNLALEEIIKIIGIENQVIRPGQAAKKRYIVKKNKLKSVSANPNEIIFSNLLSPSAKIKLWGERFKPAKEEYEDESVGDFFERRFGKEIVDRVIDPLVSGIYAGDPYKLSVQSVFPKLLDYENQYGSVTKALSKEKDKLPKRDIIAFKGGMKTLVDGLINYIGNENILCDMNVQKVNRLENGQFSIDLLQDEMNIEILADVVVFATPSFVTSKFIEPFNQDIANMLKLNYPKMLVLNLGYPRSAFRKPFDGFGFLVPSIEGKSFLGATANSAFLPDRAPKDQELFTLYLGGAKLEGSDLEALVPQAISEFEKIMKIKVPHTFKHIKVWEHSIPQYSIGHHQLVEGIEFFERNTLNLYILGNFRNGVSVSDCISGAKKTHGQLIKDYSRQSYLASIDEDFRNKQQQQKNV